MSTQYFHALTRGRWSGDIGQELREPFLMGSGLPHFQFPWGTLEYIKAFDVASYGGQ